VIASPLCTACRRDLFFSYRREGAGTGRLMAVIGIRETR
jgi:copper oxidase (laccase) domain-containing protein